MTESIEQWDGSSFDLVVVGAGPAGEKGAAQAAYFGKRVAIIEAENVGGAVVNTGTLPSKTLRETALYLSGQRSRGLYGIDYSFSREVAVDDLFYRKRLVEASHLDLVRENLARHGISLICGAAELVDAHTVVVLDADGGVARVRGEYILLAPGSRPMRPPDVPFDGERVYDTDSILRRTDEASLKARHIRRDPRVTVCVQDERAPYRSVTVYGTAAIAPREKGLDVVMARRYLGFVGGFFYLQGARRAVEQGAEEVTLIVTPERFVTQDFSPETPRVGKLWLLAKRLLPPWL